MQVRRAAAPLLVAVLVAACSSSATTAPPASAAPPASSAPSGAVAPASGSPESAAPSSAGTSGYDTGGYGKAASSASPAAGSLALATTSLGTYLVGAGGKTLYVFLADSGNTSACYGTCAANWPALTGALPALGQGLSAADFGSITRTDGTAQVTFHGHPLYYFAGDKAAGDTKGQGLNSKWYVVGADGNPIK
jgi:predicted lipoprotein with Yx(FWY)xxD motif